MFSPWSTVKAYPTKQPVSLPGKDGETNIKQIVENIPEAVDGYWYTNKYLLGNGHAQTILGGGGYNREYPVWYGRRFFKQPDGAQFSVDYCIDVSQKKPEQWSEDVKYLPDPDMPRLPRCTRCLRPEEVSKLDDAAETRPLFISVHGLTGGAHENYIRATLEEVHKILPNCEMSVITSRGCNRTKITTPQLFNGAWTEDLRKYIQYVIKKQPNRPIFLGGYSLGASILANYLGQEGCNVPEQVKCALLVCNPWDLSLCGLAIESSFVSRQLYVSQMTSNMKRLVKNNRQVMLDSALFREQEPKLKQVHRMSEFDNTMTAPLFGFNNAWEYYREASSIHRIREIRVPTLVLSAEDDPITGSYCAPYADAPANPFMYLVETTHGGHLGWFVNDGSRWHATVMAKFLRNVVDQVDFSKRYEISEELCTPKWFRDGKFQVADEGDLSI